MNEPENNIIARIKEVSEDCQFSNFREQLSITINKSELLKIAEILKNEFNFEQLIDVTAVDYLGRRDKRFNVVYFLYSISRKISIRLNVALDEGETIPTLFEIWESADWYERETYDMFGIVFDGHPDLRRFYMPEDFINPTTGEPLHPLRKDFPLMGIEGSLPLPKFPEKAKIKKNQ